MKLTIEINCNGAAIQFDPNALGDILRKTAEKLDDYEPNALVMGRIMDENGNEVGFYKRA
jgi:hypothetical protein